MDPQFFNPYEEVRKTRHNLPHWNQTGRTYFITFRLADAVPAQLYKHWESQRAIWLSLHPAPLSTEDELEYHKRFSSQIDRWLDAGHGSCVLRRYEIREMVTEALAHFDGDRHHHFSWVVMPNHVHLLTMLHPDWALEKVISTLKRRTAVTINALLGRKGQFWQHDYFDRLIRDGAHFNNVARYIRRNPEKAKLREGEYSLYEDPALPIF